MKKTTTFAVMALTVLLATSCTKEVINGSGPQVTEQRSINNFTAIDLSLNATVNYSEGIDFKVELIAQQNVLNEIRTEVHNGRLEISLPWDTKLISYAPIIINITAPAVSDFNISGSGSVQSSDTLHILNCDFNISGNGNLVLAAVETSDLDARVSGSGRIEVNGGSSENISTNISGSGNINLSGVLGSIAKVNTSGSGDATINVIDNLDVHISGSGKVYYYGNPAISADISGSGKLIHL